MRFFGALLLTLLFSPCAMALTVGPGGTHSSVQAAIDTAVASGSSHEIRVATGLRTERMRIRDLAARQVLTITGGWTAGFSRRLTDPALTILDGGGAAPVVDAFIRRGRVTFSGFTVTGGRGMSRGQGGGFRLAVQGEAEIRVEGNHIEDNQIVDSDGGGVWANVRDSGRFRMIGNAIRRNRVTGAIVASAAGADVFATDNARVVVNENTFTENVAEAKEEAHCAALCLSVQGSAQGEANDNAFAGNRSRAGTDFDIVGMDASVFDIPGKPRLVARRNSLLGNVSEGAAGGRQLDVRAIAGVLDLTDSLIADGSRDGLWASVRSGGTIHLTNLTVANHPLKGLDARRASGRLFLSNTILFGNGIDLDSLPDSVTQTANLIGTDPLFVDPAHPIHPDYRVSLGSPAIDAGANSPPGGLGPFDVIHAARIQGPRVDIGAFETSGGSGSGAACQSLFPLVPGGPAVDAIAPACLCAAEPDLLEFQCAFFHFDFFLVFRSPAAWRIGETIPVDWTLHPWQSVAGPYRMEAEARINGQGIPQTWGGPASPALKKGQLVIEPFKLALPGSGRTLLRTTVEYLGNTGGKEPERATMEILMPDPAKE